MSTTRAGELAALHSNRAASLVGGLRRRLAEVVAVDARSLALVRVGLAACLLVDLGHAALDFPSLYSDAGVLPRAVLLSFWQPGAVNSLYLLSGFAGIGYLIMALHAAAILALLVGYRTRLAVAACLVFTISLQARNYMANQGSDDLMRLLLFGALFAPLGARWSFDAALGRGRVPDRVVSLGVVALQVQAMCVYTFGALIKAEGTAWRSGHAVAMALSDGTYGTALGRLLLGLPWLLQAATYGVAVLELLMPLLIWFPIANLRVRTVALVALLLMHLSFLLLLDVGIFPYVSATSLMLFVTAAHWQWLGRHWRPASRCVALFYDRDCEFCRRTCLLLRGFCLTEQVTIEPAQSDERAADLLQRHGSWVVRDDHGVDRTRWEAVCFVFRQAPLSWPLGWLGMRPGFAQLGDALYGGIGRNRARLGRLTAPLLRPRELPPVAGPVSELLAAGFLAVILTYNIGMLGIAGGRVPGWLWQFVIDSRVEQQWSMFGPDPRSVTQWAVARSVTQGGQVLDIFGGRRRPYSEAAPLDGHVGYADSKWKKYYERLFLPPYAPLRGAYVNWLCRQVNHGVAASDRVRQVTLLLFVERPFLANPPPRQVQRLWQQACP